MNTGNRPVVLVDMDGPLADFDAHFWQRCLEKGITFDCQQSDQTARFATDHIPDPVERKTARQMVDSDLRWFYDLPPVEGAVQGVKRLALEADVWLCTKPLEANAGCRDGKAWWVHRHLGPEWERRLIIAPDKSMVRGDLLLDDAINLDWLPRATWEPVVFPTSFNGDGSDWACLPRWDWTRPACELLALWPPLEAAS